jgi:uncharacterized membrane protein YbhN (UPF0104 family)
MSLGSQVMSQVMSQVRTGSAVRGAGVAVACLVPGLARRAEVVATTYAAAWPIDKPGLQFLTVVPDEDQEPWRRAVVPIASSTASWTVAMSVLILGVRRLGVPTPVGAVLLGAGVAAADTAMSGWAEGLRAKAAAASQQAQAGQDAPAAG